MEAVLVLNRSLKKVKTKYPLVVAITPNVYENKIILEILKKENIIIEKIPWLEYNIQTKKNLSKYGISSIYNVGAKIEIFGLINYNKMVYLDADSIIIKNIDKLFKRKDGSTLVNKYSKVCFCAMFVFKPENHPLDYYRSILKHEIANDGSLMEKLWWQTKDNKIYHISDKYFYYPYMKPEYFSKKIKAYHLQNSELKYWKMQNIPNTKLGNFYKKYLDEIRFEYSKELLAIN